MIEVRLTNGDWAEVETLAAAAPAALAMMDDADDVEPGASATITAAFLTGDAETARAGLDRRALTTERTS